MQELIKPREEEFGSEMSLQMELALAGQGINSKICVLMEVGYLKILGQKLVYIIKQEIIYIYMLSIAGQTSGPNGLNFFVGNHGWPGGVLG